MKLQKFHYRLPADLIAQYPLKKRDQARLMVIDRRNREIRHDRFSHLADYLPKNSLLIVNNSKVTPARLLGCKERSGGKVEIFLLKKLEDGYSYKVLMRPVRKLKYHDIIRFDQSGLRAEIFDKNTVRFNKKYIRKDLDAIGHMPLPPYIKRNDRPSDRLDYQTVYAKRSGSIASPTAGLHFTPSLCDSLIRQGHRIEEVTLHINYATFKPVETYQIEDHQMHREFYRMNKSVYQRLMNNKKKKKPIVAVGTTSCRVLESTVQSGQLSSETDLFIYPGYHFQAVDHLITNFHQPYSTLLMLVTAFGGYSLIMRAYREAVKERYRFFSYGDAMLIL